MKNYLKKSLAIISSVILSSSLGIFADGGKENKLFEEQKELFETWLTYSSSEEQPDLKLKLNNLTKSIKNGYRNLSETYKGMMDNRFKEDEIKKIRHSILKYVWIWTIEEDIEYEKKLYEKANKLKNATEPKDSDKSCGTWPDYINSTSGDIKNLIEKINPLDQQMILYSGLENFEAKHIINLYNAGKIYDDHYKLDEWDETKEEENQEYFKNLDYFIKSKKAPKRMSHFYDSRVVDTFSKRIKEGIEPIVALNGKAKLQKIPECRKQFISTTPSLSVAIKFATYFFNTYGNDPFYILKINVPKGSNVFAVDGAALRNDSSGNGQDEVLLRGDEKFRINRIISKRTLCNGKPTSYEIIEADLLPR